MKYCDAIFEGGGVRGIGYVGAIVKFEESGYRFRNVAGSSAGAIIASLIAAGYSAPEMQEELSKVSFENFKEPNVWKGFGKIGLMLSAAKHFGLYSADLFEKWLDDLLAKKNIHTFNDVGDRLKVTTSDITEKRGLVLPDDLVKFGIDPGSFKISTAVRMSMGIPVFYEPYELIDEEGAVHYIVDGGMLSNYPIWILDNGKNKPDIPIFGFRFIRYHGENNKSKKDNLFNYMKQIITTAIEARDDDYNVIVHGDLQRTVYIDTKVGGKYVSVTDFNMNRETVIGLFKNGYDAASNFLISWNFKKWKSQFRRTGFLFSVGKRESHRSAIKLWSRPSN